MARWIVAVGIPVLGLAFAVLMPPGAQASHNPPDKDCLGWCDGDVPSKRLQTAPALLIQVAESGEGQWMRVHPRAVFPQFVPRTQKAQPDKPHKTQTGRKPPKITGKAKDKPASVATSQISCESAVEIVEGYGFSDVKTTSCAGANFAFEALRDGAAYSITLSAGDGELMEVKKR